MLIPVGAERAPALQAWRQHWSITTGQGVAFAVRGSEFGNLFQRRPERLFEADAGFVTADDNRPFLR